MTQRVKAKSLVAGDLWSLSRQSLAWLSRRFSQVNSTAIASEFAIFVNAWYQGSKLDVTESNGLSLCRLCGIGHDGELIEDTDLNRFHGLTALSLIVWPDPKLSLRHRPAFSEARTSRTRLIRTSILVQTSEHQCIASIKSFAQQLRGMSFQSIE